MREQQVKVGVGVICLTPDGVVLLQRQGSHGAGEWSFPGGHLEFGESVLDCAARECEEEIGVKLSSCYHLYFFTEDSFPGKQYITIYVVGTTEDKAKICEPHKASAIIFINNTDAVPEPAFSGVKKAWEVYNRLPNTITDDECNRQNKT
jgi:8-oxo-dGTP diphosphatase